jgi:tetratricopeptide (TPR) repeat protein
MVKKLFVLIFILISLESVGLLPGQANNSENAESFFLKCKSSLKEGNADKAIEFGEKAVELNNKVAKYYQYLGNAYNMKLRKVPDFEKLMYATKLRDSWEKACQLDSKNVEVRIGLAHYYIIAPAFAGGNLEKAKVHATETLKLDPLNGHTLFTKIYLTEKDFASAEKSMETAFKRYLDFKKKHPSETSLFDENILNSYGYQLIKQEKIEKALKYFKMNVKAFPGSYNVYDSMGELYLLKGNKELALDYYEKASKMNPKKSEWDIKNYNAEVEIIKKLKKELDR